MNEDETNRSNVEASRPKDTQWFFWIMSLLTALWGLGVIALALGYFPNLAPPSKLNEWGDFVAGAAAPLAFFWLVGAVVIQSRELREQRQELRLTRHEFEHTREVLKAQAIEAKRHAELVEQQTFMQREQASAKLARIDVRFDASDLATPNDFNLMTPRYHAENVGSSVATEVRGAAKVTFFIDGDLVRSADFLLTQLPDIVARQSVHMKFANTDFVMSDAERAAALLRKLRLVIAFHISYKDIFAGQRGIDETFEGFLENLNGNFHTHLRLL